MKDILTYILKNITTQPDDISIEEVEENGVLNFTISVNAEDVGRVIGKEGKIIKAIRSIMRVAAIQKGVRVRVSVLSESDNSPAPTQAESTETDEVVLATEESEAKEPEVAVVESTETPQSEETAPQTPPQEEELTLDL